jgi:signal transduction histidine kinase
LRRIVSTMSFRLSEPASSRRVRAFLRRWHKRGLRALVEALAVPPGGPVALVDADGVLLALLRAREGDPLPVEDLRTVTFGDPAAARLLGDVPSLPRPTVDVIGSLVLAIDELGREMDELSSHALERYRELSLLYDFSEKASSAIALAEVMSLILAKAVAIVRASGASVVTLDPETPRRKVLASVGTVPEIGKAAIARIVASGHPFVGMDESSLREVKGDAWSGTLACLPLRAGERTSGVLVVLAGPGRELRPDDQRLLTALASLAAIRIEQASLAEATARRRELAAIGHVASAIVHDFKNPLTAIRGFAEMVQMPEIPVEEHASMAGQIIENADRMWRMVEEILHFVRGSASSLDLAPISAEQLSDRLLASIKPAVPSRAELTVRLEGVGTFVADVPKLERAVGNLVRNAVEATGGRGKVSITGGAGEDGMVLISVQDDGPGIPAGIQEQLFDPFVTAGKKGGTGLGLAIVKKIVEDHGGRVAVQSAPGQGARFDLLLPRDPSARGKRV